MRTEQAIIDELLSRKKAGTLKEDGYDEVCRRKPLDKSKVAAVEKSLGYPLPPLLKRMYAKSLTEALCESYGLIGLVGGLAMIWATMRCNCYATSKSPMRRSEWKWPDGLLPAFHLGCAMYLCIDCRNTKGKVVLFEPNNHEDGLLMERLFFDVQLVAQEAYG